MAKGVEDVELLSKYPMHTISTQTSDPNLDLVPNELGDLALEDLNCRLAGMDGILATLHGVLDKTEAEAVPSQAEVGAHHDCEEEEHTLEALAAHDGLGAVEVLPDRPAEVPPQAEDRAGVVGLGVLLASHSGEWCPAQPGQVSPGLT